MSCRSCNEERSVITSVIAVVDSRNTRHRLRDKQIRRAIPIIAKYRKLVEYKLHGQALVFCRWEMDRAEQAISETVIRDVRDQQDSETAIPRRLFCVT